MSWRSLLDHGVCVCPAKELDISLEVMRNNWKDLRKQVMGLDR